MVFPLVAVLVAAGVLTAVIASDDGDPGAPIGLPSGRATACTGGYCVGPFPYANACAALMPQGAWHDLFSVGTQAVRIDETFTDPLPVAATNLESACRLAPIKDNPIWWIELHLRETETTQGVPVEPGTGTGKPLAGVPGAVVFTEDELVDVHWVHGNISAKLDVESARDLPPVADAKLAELVRQVDEELATPKGPAAPVAGGTRGDAKVYTDTCAVFTAADFQRATGFALVPDYVQREYSDQGYDEKLGSTCKRYTAKDDSDYPKPAGTKYSGEVLDPEVTIYPARDEAAAQKAFAEDKAQLSTAAAVPGVGDAAVFGGTGSLVFVQGFHVVQVQCSSRNTDLRAELTALAKAISARMP